MCESDALYNGGVKTCGRNCSTLASPLCYISYLVFLSLQVSVRSGGMTIRLQAEGSVAVQLDVVYTVIRAGKRYCGT